MPFLEVESEKKNDQTNNVTNQTYFYPKSDKYKEYKSTLYKLNDVILHGTFKTFSIMDLTQKSEG